MTKVRFKLRYELDLDNYGIHVNNTMRELLETRQYMTVNYWKSAYVFRVHENSWIWTIDMLDLETFTATVIAGEPENPWYSLLGQTFEVFQHPNLESMYVVEREQRMLLHNLVPLLPREVLEFGEFDNEKSKKMRLIRRNRIAVMSASHVKFNDRRLAIINKLEKELEQCK